jgi:hypothetical protein
MQRDQMLYWKRSDGTPYSYLSSLPRTLEREAGRLLFATNAGMFDPGLKPVGFYVEQGTGARARKYQIRPWQLPHEAEWDLLYRRRWGGRGRNTGIAQAAPPDGPIRKSRGASRQ